MADSFTQVFTPVFRPRLPEAERLLPYLRRIDQSRVYSNFGPLALELSQRLGARFGLPAERVITAASGTAALTGAILGAVGRAERVRPIALIPSFTFVATAAAVQACGYEIRFADIDENSFLLEPAQALAHPALDRVGLVIPVGAFGRAVPQSGWRRFRDDTGIGVVIDGAACFESVSAAPGSLLGEIPVALSFHATKSFGSGEGGCVITGGMDMSKETVRALNFGFFGTRESRAASINGKMSEYHAAVGLAELDGWQDKSQALTAVAEHYRKCFTARGLRERFIGAPDTASCYALFHCETASEGQGVAAGLEADGIGNRFWYGRGVHNEPYFSHLPASEMRVTENVADRVLGLPVAPDLAPESIEKIADKVASLCQH